MTTLIYEKSFVEAELAFEQGEVPVGAVIVIDQKIIARAHNLTELLNDVTAHAEVRPSRRLQII